MMRSLLLILPFVFLYNFTNAQEAGNSLAYDGVDESTSIGNPATLQLTNYTVEVWFYGTDKNKSIITRGNARGNNSERIFDLLGNGFVLKIVLCNDGGTGHDHTIGAYTSDQWNHVAIIKNGTSLTTYLNGQNPVTSTLAITPSTNKFDWDIAGINTSGINYQYIGRIDEVRIWNSARTITEIRDNMHSVLTGAESNLAFYANFNSATGSTLSDLSTPSENGTNVNMENADWVTSYAPIGNSTARSQTDLRGLWQAGLTLNSLESDGFWMNVGTTLTETNYAVYGHDNAGSAIVTTDLPVGSVERYEQTWYVDEFGTVTPNITFDLSTIHGAAITGLLSAYRLLYRAGTTGTFTDLGPATSIANTDQITFSGVALADGYYTIGRTTALPIELISFDANLIDNKHVKIEWTTVTETNNDYFIVERSQNGADWQGIEKIDGKGNSTKELYYTSFDYSPFVGKSYYRLKQIDFNGKNSYSSIRSINMGYSKEYIQIYPNPTSKLITITGNAIEPEQIKIYNTLGQNVTESTKTIDNNETKMIVDLSSLETGFYYVITKTTANKVCYEKP